MSVGPQERSYIMFDISSILPSANVTSASLRLCRTNGSGGVRTHELRAVTSAWTESGLIWNNQPTFATSADATISVPSSAGCVDTDVTVDVQAWVLVAPNFGWRIADIDELTAPLVDWATHENSTTADRPTLSVTYTP
jgi:hypothetical protein